MREATGILALLLIVIALLNQNRKLTEAALVRTSPSAAAMLAKPGPALSGWAKRRHARNPQAEPEAKQVDYAQPGVMIGL